MAGSPVAGDCTGAVIGAGRVRVATGGEWTADCCECAAPSSGGHAGGLFAAADPAEAAGVGAHGSQCQSGGAVGESGSCAWLCVGQDALSSSADLWCCSTQAAVERGCSGCCTPTFVEEERGGALHTFIFPFGCTRHVGSIFPDVGRTADFMPTGLFPCALLCTNGCCFFALNGSRQPFPRVVIFVTI